MFSKRDFDRRIKVFVQGCENVSMYHLFEKSEGRNEESMGLFGCLFGDGLFRFSRDVAGSTHEKFAGAHPDVSYA